MGDSSSKPGDLIGRGEDGQLRLVRTVPLHWLLSVVGVVALHGIVSWVQLGVTTEAVKKVEARLDNYLGAIALMQAHDAEQGAEIRELRRRLESLEGQRAPR